MNRIFIYLFPLLTLTACSDDEGLFTGNDFDWNIEIPAPHPNEVIDKEVFQLFNLDHPGLEKAKEYYEKEEYYYGAQQLLEYYRVRTAIENPNVSLIHVQATDADRSKADYALDDYRFFVNNYYEDADAGKPYSLKKNGTIDWGFKPEGADDEYQKQLHRHQWFVPQAKTYRATKNEKYIESWIAVYSDWLKQNPMPQEGTNTTSWWQLQVAERVYGQIELFDYYKHSVHFTPQWFSTFMVHFAAHADFLVKYPYSGGNILVSQATSLAFAGVLFPELKNAETWMNTGYKILGEEVRTQFLEDGMHMELDLSYHISAIADFYDVMKLAEANQVTSRLPADFKESLRKASELVMHFTFPNFFNSRLSGQCVPGFNDTRQASWTRSVLTRNFKRYVEMFPDNHELLYMATAGQQGSRPDTDPKVFDKSGYYVLRTGWEPICTMLIHSNNYDYSDSPLRLWSHNQPDNGTFELYHNGRNFFPDTGVYAYYESGGSNDDRRWFRQTSVHNTLTLDQADITTAKGKLLKSSTEGNVQAIVTENPGYANLKHRRYIFLVDQKFVVLVDEGIGNAAGTINLNFNLCEDENKINASAYKGIRTDFADGNNIVTGSFGNKDITFSTFTGKVSYVLTSATERKAYRVNMEKAAHETARFITVICPVQGSTAATTLSASFRNETYNESGVSLEITIDGVVYDIEYHL
ncbi:MAG: heparinase II/III family protein [Bacteroides sp.]|nr:heparinase II/III family protein [Bacteroides sp.]